MVEVLGYEDLESLVKLGIPVINKDRNYWFVRTQGGEYFDDFYFDNFIGIEWDEICDIEFIKNNDSEILKGVVHKEYPSNKQPGYVANRIKTFVCDMKKGDIVLIPSSNSERIAFGEICDDEIFIYDGREELDFFDAMEDENNEIKEKTILKKRRKVKWIEVINRRDLDPYLYKIIYSHNTIVNAKPYEVFIDRALYPIYIKENKGYLTYRVTTNEDISGIDISEFILENLSLMQEIAKEKEININKRDVTSKINVQSPGDIQFIGPVFCIFIMATASVAIFGGEVGAFGLKFKTEGLSKNILEWYKIIQEKKEKTEVKKLQETIDNLKINLGTKKEIAVTKDDHNIKE